MRKVFVNIVALLLLNIQLANADGFTDFVQNLADKVYSNTATETDIKILQAIIQTNIDGRWGPASYQALKRFEQRYNIENEQARIAREKAAEEERLREQKQAALRQVKREFVSRQIFKLAHGSENGIAEFYEKAVSKLKSDGVRNAGLLDVKIDYRPKDWRYNHVLVFENRKARYTVTSDTHMFRWNRIANVRVDQKFEDRTHSTTRDALYALNSHILDMRKLEEDSQFRSIKHARRINRKRSQIAEDAKHTYETAPNDRSITRKYKEFLRIEARLAAATDAYLADR